MRQIERWLRGYESRKHSRQVGQISENWQSNKYDFSDPYVGLEMKCSVGGCISALKKSWRAFYIAGCNGEPRGDIAYRINHIQDSLGLDLTEFYEYPGIYQSQVESRDVEEWNSDTNEPYMDEMSKEEKEAYREQKAEEKNDDW